MESPVCSQDGSEEKINLVVCSTNPVVDNVKHGLVENGSGGNEGDDTNHGETSIEDLGFLGESELEGRQVSEGVVVSRNSLFVVGVVGVQKKRISERKRADGGHQRNSEKVGVSNKDNSSLHADGVLVGDGGKGSPFLEGKKGVGIRDKSVSLGVSTGADDNPTKHGMAPVPLFGLDRRPPSVFGQGTELAFPVLLSSLVNFRVDDV
jgi:hypothetical protein